MDSVVTDPPYEIGFMNRSFDSTGIAFDVDPVEGYPSVLKPGGHVAAFAASRTYHRLACAIEDAGFEIRDQIDWVYASGMPHGSGCDAHDRPGTPRGCGADAIRDGETVQRLGTAS